MKTMRKTEHPLLLTFDVGTQSTRALLVDPSGRMVGRVRKGYGEPYYSLRPNWAEQDPAFYWNKIGEACRELKEKAGDRWKDIVAVTCTCIRATPVCLDRDGNPLRDAILWMDRRVEENIPPLSLPVRLLFRILGLRDAIRTFRTQMACNWIAVNERDVWNATRKYGFLSTYLNAQFTGSLRDSCANMSGVMPYDARKRRWYPKWDFHRELYMVTDDRLVELVEPGTVIGEITEKAAESTGIPAGLPYLVTGSDKMCESLGLGCVRNDRAAISLGTMCSIQVPSERYFTQRLILPPFSSLTGNYLNEVQTYRGFWLVSWFRDQFASDEVREAEQKGCHVEELFDARLADVPPGCDGLLMQPTLTPDAITPHARGVFLGLTDRHTRMHFFRAIIEGIGFTLYDGLKSLEKAGRSKIRSVVIAGGGSNSPEICQIIADISGVPAHRIQTEDAAGLGSSLLAFLKLGYFRTLEDALASMVHVQQRFEPDPRVHAFYDRLYEKVYRRVFPKLKRLYRNIDEIILTGEHGKPGDPPDG